MTSTANSRSNPRVPELDGIRGLAILLVVFFHYWWETFHRASGIVLHAIGSALILSWSGVDLFFVLSGFLIGGILIDHRDSGNYFSTFYIRRVCRILPAYFLWLALFFLIPLFLPDNTPQWCSQIFQTQIPKFPKWGYFLFLQNFYLARTGLVASAWLVVTWSLTVEEQFYLLLPLTVRFLLPRKPLGLLIFLIVLVPVFRTFLFLFHPATLVYVLLPCRADALLLGVLCAYLVRDTIWRQRLENNRKWLYLACIILLLGLTYLSVTSNAVVKTDDVTPAVNSFEMVTFGYSWLALFYGCFLLIVVTAKTSVLASVTRFRLLQHFGLIAYGMYLIHMAINGLVHGLVLGTGGVQ